MLMSFSCIRLLCMWNMKNNLDVGLTVWNAGVIMVCSFAHGKGGQGSHILQWL